MKKICRTKRAKATHPLEVKRAKTEMVVLVWRQRWKTAIAICSLLLPSLPAFPNTVIVNVSPRTPCTRQARVTSGRNHLRRTRTKRGTAKTRGRENAAPAKPEPTKKFPPLPSKLEEFVLTNL